jgi:hypothetical protein
MTVPNTLESKDEILDQALKQAREPEQFRLQLIANLLAYVTPENLHNACQGALDAQSTTRSFHED